MDDLRNAGSALESAAGRFDPSVCSGDEATAMVKELGKQRRLIDGMLGKSLKRVDDTAAHTRGTDRSAAELGARLVGVGTGEAKRAIETAAKLEGLPATQAAVGAGTLSAHDADLIAATAIDDPSVERSLLQAASKGHVALRDTCIEVRAAREDQAERATRQHKARSFMMWPTPDGMVEGHFKVTPEVGGAIKAVVEDGTRRKFREARSAGVRESQDAYAADAFADRMCGDQADAKSGGFTTHILIDHEALLRGHALPGETCEIPGVGPVNVEWVQSLLGEAFLTAVIKHGKNIATVAHLGRHTPAEVQTALIVSGRECSIDGCTGREYLERDHCEIDHANRGPTAFWNLTWLCSIHHDRKSAGWILGPPDPGTRKRTLTPPIGSAGNETGRAA